MWPHPTSENLVKNIMGIGQADNRQMPGKTSSGKLKSSNLEKLKKTKQQQRQQKITEYVYKYSLCNTSTMKGHG